MLKVCMVTALVFMPADYIYKGFQEVSMIMPEEFKDFFKYFEKTYIGMPKVVSMPRETICLGWKDAKFLPSTSSVYKRILVDYLHMNNVLEGWHNRLSGVVGDAHPDIKNFLKSLKSEQSRGKWSIVLR